jgi:hypothetical protein
LQETLQTEEGADQKKTRHFLEGTFSYNMSKQPSKKKTNSVIETKRQLNCLIKEKSTKRQGKTGKSTEMVSRTGKTCLNNLTKLQLD